MVEEKNVEVLKAGINDDINAIKLSSYQQLSEGFVNLIAVDVDERAMKFRNKMPN
jgi:predicted methyltransferase